MEDEDNMVVIIEARKSFGPNNHVLNGVNMTIKKNTIYGLLGPSGSGKTMLLTCLLGMNPLNSGKIHIGVKSLKDVGYMPQEVALYQEFTIRETLHFFGSLFGLSKAELKSRTAELTKVLELPLLNKIVGSLSGGEQRRVSFSVALLHDPQFLVLDEPTVGVDPILSYSMWQYLMKLTTEGKTIIVTTHYIEEAKHAHKIGLMRNGSLLLEDTPCSVLKTQSVETLEDAFLKLSKKQEFERVDERIQDGNNFSNDVEQVCFERNVIFNWNRFKAQIMKNICWIKRNTLIMTFLLVLPAMQSFLYSASFGQNPMKLKFLVVSEELTETDACSFHPSGPYYIEPLNCTYSFPFTCYYAEILNRTFDIGFVYNLAEAKARVAHNKAWGIVHIQPNFTDSLIEKMYEEIDTSDESLDSSTILVTMDMSNYIIANYIKKQIVDDLRTFMEDLTKSCGINHIFGSSALRFMNPVFGQKVPVFADSGLPGFFCSFCFYFTMIFTSGALMMEKIVGTLNRSMAAGMTYFEVVSAHLVVQFVLMTIQKSVMFFIFYYCYDFPLIGNIIIIVLLLYFIEFVGISYGFLLTEVFASDRLVSYAGIGGTLAVFSLGGIIWPIEGAHYLIKSWIWAFPVVPAVESYKNISLKGYSFTHSTVYRGFLSCIVWTMALSFFSYILARANKCQKSSK